MYIKLILLVVLVKLFLYACILLFMVKVVLNCNLDHFSINRMSGMPQIAGSQTSQEEDKISSMFEDTLLEKSNIILLGPTGCGMHFLISILVFLLCIYKLLKIYFFDQEKHC